MHRSIIYLGLFPLLIILIGCEANEPSAPISFKEIHGRADTDAGKSRFLKASDGIDLAYYVTLPPGKPAAAVIFLHGGGAYSEAGYQQLAAGLNGKYETAVYLCDLRGHGRSGGPRGDAPSVEQVWNDLNLFIATVRKSHPGIPLYLGGHSSGAGLILNYIAWNWKADVNGYFFIAPQFGYKSDTERTDSKTSFAKPRTWVFVLSAMSGGHLFAHTRAVDFNYPAAVLAAKPLMLKSISRNMALAMTPDKPEEQFGQIKRPFGLFIGAADDLFVPEKVRRFAGYAEGTARGQSVSQIVPKENHLSILLVADELIGKTIQNWLQNNRRIEK